MLLSRGAPYWAVLKARRRREMATRTGRSRKRDSGIKNGTVDGVHVASPEEGRALFDRQAHKALGISGDEFLRRWDAGAYRPVPDTADGRKVSRLVMLMPFARRTKA